MEEPSTILASSSIGLIAPSDGIVYVPSTSALGLIIEDDSSIAVRFMDVLGQAGFHCLVVKNSNQAVALLARYRPQLALLDISSFADEAADLVRYIKLRIPDAHFVGITRDPREWAANASLELGLDGIHTVWPDRERLLRLCARVIREQHLCA
jgi:DNA-binding NtrC family response regulator